MPSPASGAQSLRALAVQLPQRNAALRAFLADDATWVVPVDTLIKDEDYIKALVTETWTQYRTSGRSSAAFFGRNKQVWRMLALTALVKRQSLVQAA